jgi:pyruvate,water dikinase
MRPQKTTESVVIAAAWRACADAGTACSKVFNFRSFAMSTTFQFRPIGRSVSSLRMTDVEVGGRQECQPWGDDFQSALWRQSAHRLCHHGTRISRIFEALTVLTRRSMRQAEALDTEDVRALAQVGAEIRAMVEAQPFPPDLEQGIREAFADPERRQF